jgi:hypothetical protein
MPAAPTSGLTLPALITLSSLANSTPATPSTAKATIPSTRMASVLGLRNSLPTMVEPIARPRNSVTVLAISVDEALVRRSTAPDSFIKLPSMSMPISGVAKGTSVPTSTVTAIGNRMRVRRPIVRWL